MISRVLSTPQDMSSTEAVRVLILCTGNICRSPVAEAMIAEKFELIDNILVESRGLNAPNGVKPHPLASKTSSLLGYSLNPSKTSEQVSVEDLNLSDLILVMELAHKKAVKAMSPRADAKTFLLGHWSVGEIQDPLGTSEENFAAVAQKISRASDEWRAKLLIVGIEAVKAYRR
jgi:protein-tyrosine phosphatase